MDVDNLSYRENPPARVVNQGRRANSKSPVPWSLTEIKSNVENTNGPTLNEENSTDYAPERSSRRKGVWGNTENKTQEFDFRLVQENIDEEDNDMPIIPTLEDDTLEHVDEFEIAAPPTTLLHDLLSYGDLSADLIRIGSYQKLDGDIDMKILTKTLLPIKECLEEDRVWSFNELFVDVATFIQQHESQNFGGFRENLI